MTLVTWNPQQISNTQQQQRPATTHCTAARQCSCVLSTESLGFPDPPRARCSSANIWVQAPLTRKALICWGAVICGPGPEMDQSLKRSISSLDLAPERSRHTGSTLRSAIEPGLPEGFPRSSLSSSSLSSRTSRSKSHWKYSFRLGDVNPNHKD